jgi:hypothetical protein
MLVGAQRQDLLARMKVKVWHEARQESGRWLLKEKEKSLMSVEARRVVGPQMLVGAQRQYLSRMEVKVAASPISNHGHRRAGRRGRKHVRR